VTTPGRPWWRRQLFVAATGGVLVLVALATVLLTPAGEDVSLDPTNPAPGGARATAQILQAHGILLHQVSSVAAARSATASAGSHATLLVTNADLVDPTVLTDLARDAADLVLVTPGQDALDAVLPGSLVLPAGHAPTASRSAGCQDPDARAAGSTTAAGALYHLDATGLLARVAGASLCYAQADVTDTGAVVVVTYDNGQRVTVLGQPEVLTNASLGLDGNAALSLRMLGHQQDLLWYRPDPLELGGDQPSLASLLPPWVGWVSLQLVVAVLVAMAWRARRFGPLVREPLPVVVRAAETTEGRARLYRQAGARGWAAATLRTAALRRLARRFEAGPTTTPEQLVATVAAATGRHDPGPSATLLGPAPSNDAALVRLADAIDSLEQDVRS